MSVRLTDPDAVMIGFAFEYAMSNPGSKPDLIDEYIYEHASDRRYKLRWLAATTDYRSAKVQYRGRTLFVYITWVSDGTGGAGGGHWHWQVTR